MTEYVLAATAREPADPRETARVIAEQTGQALFDARRQLHHGRGLLAEHLTLDAAQRLGAAISALGVGVVVLPAAALPPPVRPLRVTKAAVTPAGFQIEDQFQRARLEPWTALVLATAATIETVEGDAAELLRHGAQPKRERPTLKLFGEEDEERLARRHLVELVFDEAAPRHYRIEAGSFNYSYLGDRLALRAETNLATLAGDLVRVIPEALVTPALRAFAAGEVDPSAILAEARLWDADVRWQVLRRGWWTGPQVGPAAG